MPAARPSERPRSAPRSTSRGIFRGGKPAAGKTGAGKPLVAPRPAGSGPADTEHEILFQQYFKSVGPRTYAAQVKRANNGNHYIVLTEGKRDDKTSEVRKTRLFVYSEDFVEFFKLMKSAAEFIKTHPMPKDMQARREKFWTKRAAAALGGESKPVTSTPGTLHLIAPGSAAPVIAGRPVAGTSPARATAQPPKA